MLLIESMKVNNDDTYKTLIKKRIVYGGGGIIPDYFIPLDTNGTSPYFSKLIRKGIFNQFALYWVNNNRSVLEKKYPTFDVFNSKFNSKHIIKELISYAEKENVEFNEEEYNDAEKTINVRLKANIAQDLFDYEQFYQVINELNNTLQKAILLIENEEAFSKLASNK